MAGCMSTGLRCIRHGAKGPATRRGALLLASFDGRPPTTKRCYGGLATMHSFMNSTTEKQTPARRFTHQKTPAVPAEKRSPARAQDQETHGGDDIHRVKKLICDFSVTTNALGPVADAVHAMRQLMNDGDSFSVLSRRTDMNAIFDDEGEHIMSAPAVEHYPQREDPELTRTAAEFFLPDDSEANVADLEARLIFGNGASELIDVLARAAPKGSYCTSPLTMTQYKEYERACEVSRRTSVPKAADAALVCLVNPTNPTGDFVERADMEKWIEDNASPGSWVVVDESMLFWAGPDWHKRGVSHEFVEKMVKRDVMVFMVYSWTKIFSCTGLRIGSVICPTADARKKLNARQVPWSVNVFARTYLQAALKDKDYLERTWRLTAIWRDNTVSKLQKLHPSWKFYGQPFTSWVWIDTGDEAIAKAVYEASLKAGCPVRHAAAGYKLPTFIRVAVRRPYDFSVLYQALLKQEYEYYSKSQSMVHLGTFADVEPSVVEGVHLVHIDDVKEHEQVSVEREAKLQNYMNEMSLKTLPAIIVDSKHQVVIDGHHRLELFRASGMSIVPAVFVNYDHEDILVVPPGADEVTKETVIDSAIKGELLPPKSTQHMVRSRAGALMPIVVLSPQIVETQ